MIGDCQKPIDDSAAATALKVPDGQRLLRYFHGGHIRGLDCEGGNIFYDRYQGNRACGTFLLTSKRNAASLTPMEQNGRPSVSMETTLSLLWREGMKEIACCATSTKRKGGGPLDDEGYELTYFSYLPSNEPSNLQAPFLRHRGRRMTMRHRYYVLENLQSNAVYVVIKGVRLSPFFFLIYRERIRKPPNGLVNVDHQ